jgi:CheY-like chemotaxis protein
VLVVEDDLDVREMLEMWLQFNGYTTDVACNGREALDRAIKRRPCVVLLDLMMPVMDGWEFRRRQRADPRIADVPVVCVSAVHDQAGASGDLETLCMSKPVDLDVLLAVISENCVTAS